MIKNYESKYWSLIYDQMMERDPLAGWLDVNREFYTSRLGAVEGPILECACGTGLIMQHLLERGFDVYGFDASAAMLAAYRRKSSDVEARLSCQSFESFDYARRFEAIIIPTNSFSMLTTREAQLVTLRNVRRHLIADGMLLLDIRLADREQLAADANGLEGRWHEWSHPDAGGVIRQRIVAKPHDFEHQIYRDRCFFEYGDDKEDFPMPSRWIFKAEVEGLASQAGFTVRDFESFEWGGYWTLGVQ